MQASVFRGGPVQHMGNHNYIGLSGAWECWIEKSPYIIFFYSFHFVDYFVSLIFFINT